MTSNPKNKDSIPIFKNHVLVGKLKRTKMGCEFEINKSYQQKYPKTQITYHITTENLLYSYSGAGLPPYFAGLLPEGLRLKALIKKIKTSADDMFSLLANAGHDQVGDLHFQDNDQALDRADDLLLDFKKIKVDNQYVKNIDSTSLAGVQDKISADRLLLPINLKNKNKSYLLKLPSEDFVESIQNEMICLQIAKSCGLKVNTAKIITDKNDIQALLIERFDRQWDSKNKNWQRFHQEDACQFLNKYPADKYIISFQEIAEGIKIFSASPEIEILKLLQLKAFSYLIGNGDLHAKNISLLKDQMSPCYDILCTSIYGDEKMALLFDGKNENLKRKNFIDFGERYGIPKLAIESMLSQLVKKFKKNHEKIFVLKIAQEKKKFLEQMFKKRGTNLT